MCKVSVMSDIGLQNSSFKLVLNSSVLQNGMEVSSTLMASILMNYLNIKKETNIKQLKVIQEVKLILTTVLSLNQLTFSFQLLWKRLSTKTMLTNSKPNLS